jgi:hypothetical protein
MCCCASLNPVSFHVCLSVCLTVSPSICARAQCAMVCPCGSAYPARMHRAPLACTPRFGSVRTCGCASFSPESFRVCPSVCLTCVRATLAVRDGVPVWQCLPCPRASRIACVHPSLWGRFSPRPYTLEDVPPRTCGCALFSPVSLRVCPSVCLTARLSPVRVPHSPSAMVCPCGSVFACIARRPNRLRAPFAVGPFPPRPHTQEDVWLRNAEVTSHLAQGVAAAEQWSEWCDFVAPLLMPTGPSSPSSGARGGGSSTSAGQLHDTT